MAFTLWTKNGFLLEDEADGKLIECEECPCSDCSAYPSSFAASLTNFSTPYTGTLSLLSPLEECREVLGVDVPYIPCWWYGKLVNGSNLIRCYLHVSTVDRGSPPEWTITFGTVFLPNPASCFYTDDLTQASHVIYSSGSPYGTYGTHGPSSRGCILS